MVSILALSFAAIAECFAFISLCNAVSQSSPYMFHFASSTKLSICFAVFSTDNFSLLHFLVYSQFYDKKLCMTKLFAREYGLNDPVCVGFVVGSLGFEPSPQWRCHPQTPHLLVKIQSNNQQQLKIINNLRIS